MNQCLIFALVDFVVLPSASAASFVAHGDDFVLAVEEPAGWIGECCSKATDMYHANAIFHRKEESGLTAIAPIRVVLLSAGDGNTAADLESDMNEYRRRYREVAFNDIDVHSDRYKAFPELFYVPGYFHEYVTYLNLGLGNHFAVSVAMNTQKRSATAEELAAYREVVESLNVYELPAASVQR